MAFTNFAALTAEQKTVWSRDLWRQVRAALFIKRFLGTGTGAMIQRITELTKTEKGDRVLMHLVADLVGDGVVGDSEREGFEEKMQSFTLDLRIDQLAHQVRNTGKMADQRTIINFRTEARDNLAYWLSNRLDQLAFLTLSGISYAFHTNGRPRVGSNLSALDFAADVSPPSANRHQRWIGASNTLTAGDTTAIAATDTPSYAMIVNLLAYAKDKGVPRLKSGGKEYYVLLMHPMAIKRLKLDKDYLAAVQNAATRGDDNPIFTGAVGTIDGATIHEHELVFETRGAASGQKWGAGGLIDGTRTLCCGSQALGMADLGTPDWVEKKFQYDSSLGISVDKMFGFRKPKFFSQRDNAVEDFGVVACDHAL